MVPSIKSKFHHIDELVGLTKTIITFSCDIEDAEKIDEYCRRNGLNRSWFIRECVMQVVDGIVPLIIRDKP
ncbi:MAG TPA: CopG family transcriptional regulator [Nitrososphaeria archaeon]|nr:CopG family transcriptional regulator [Nitrososphaeria archaeon]